MVYVDESGFYLLPAVVKTYAPCGETPVLRHRLTRDHLSAISGITPDGKLYLLVQEKAFTSAGIIEFLKHLQRHLGDKLLILWDGAPIHRSQVIKQYLSETNGDIHLESFPGYAPELNPDEGIWKHLKRVELKNLCCQTLPALRTHLRGAVQRLRQKKRVILGCIKQTGLL